MTVILTSATATCPVEGSGVKKSQIGSTRERAVQIVTDAMNRHIAEEHPSESGPSVSREFEDHADRRLGPVVDG